MLDKYVEIRESGIKQSLKFNTSKGGMTMK